MYQLSKCSKGYCTASHVYCFQYYTHTKSDDGICICADNGELLNTVYKMIDYY